jgi:hypothetical protein
MRSATALDAARAQALRAYIGCGVLTLDNDTYRALRRRGFGRRDVDRALDTMTAADEILVETGPGSVRVRLAPHSHGRATA